MMDIPHIKCKNQQKMSSNRRNNVWCKEIGIKESHSGVKIFTGNSYIAVSTHAQRKCG